MKPVTIDGASFLMAVPFLGMVQKFPDLETKGKPCYKKTRIFCQEYYANTDTYNLQTLTKQGNHVFQMSVRVQGDESCVTLSKLNNALYYLRPMLIPLDDNGFLDYHAQGDCPNGTTTTGGHVYLNGHPISHLKSQVLADSVDFIVGDTLDGAAPIEWMWWENRLIMADSKLRCPAATIRNNRLMGGAL